MKKRSFTSFILELFIVIIGVSIAFLLNNYNQKIAAHEIEIQYYEELIEDLSYDKKVLEFVIKINDEKKVKMLNAIKFYESPKENKDSILNYLFQIGNYSFFNAKDVTYQAIINSGDFKLLKSKPIKKGLVALYARFKLIDEVQTSFLNALDQNFFPKLVANVDYSSGKVVNENFYIEPEIKNYFMYSANDLSIHIDHYKRALKAVDNLLNLMQKEVDQYNR